MPRPRRQHLSQQRHEPGHHPRPGRAAALTTAAIAMVLAILAACSDDAELDQGPGTPARLATTTPAPTPTDGDPVITVAPAAEEFTADPAVEGFLAYEKVSARVLRSEGADRAGLTDVATGQTLENFYSELQDYEEKGWQFVGTPRFSIVGLRTMDDTHRHVLTCEYGSASYAATEDGQPVSPAEDKWIAGEHWMVLVDGKWKLEHIYYGDHSCDMAN